MEFQPSALGIQPRIIDGHTHFESIRWQALLSYRNESGCGAVVLDQTTILTAGHCTLHVVDVEIKPDGNLTLIREMDTNPVNYLISVGIKKKSNAAKTGVIPSKIIPHPNFSKDSTPGMGDDIAIIKLPWKHRITYGHLPKSKYVGRTRHFLLQTTFNFFPKDIFKLG